MMDGEEFTSEEIRWSEEKYFDCLASFFEGLHTGLTRGTLSAGEVMDKLEGLKNDYHT